VRVIGGAPGADTDRQGQLERIFELARAYDCDIDLHIDFGSDASELDLERVLGLTERDKMGGRVAMAHVTKLSTLPLAEQKAIARRLADAGIAIAVLPATDSFLMGRDQTDNVRRGVVDGHMLIRQGMNATVGSNNIVNAFTPFGDCSLVRLANFYAHIVQVSTDDDMRTLWEMITTRAARMMNLRDYGLAVGNPADLVVMDTADPVQAIREVRQPVMAFKRGRLTLDWPKPRLIGGPRPTAT
jgi:cytosine deaminase